MTWPDAARKTRRATDRIVRVDALGVPSPNRCSIGRSPGEADMNPFLLIPAKPAANDLLPADEGKSSLRMMRLHEDLTALATGMDAGGWASVTIVQTPDRLQVSGQGSGETVTPLLAMALLADLERTIAAAEKVRARLPAAWRRLPGL